MDQKRSRFLPAQKTIMYLVAFSAWQGTVLVWEYYLSLPGTSSKFSIRAA